MDYDAHDALLHHIFRQVTTTILRLSSLSDAFVDARRRLV